MLFKSPGKVLENSLNRKLANLYEPWRQNEEPQAGSLHTSKCDDTAKQGNASWAADSTEAVFEEAVVGHGWHYDTSR